MIDRVSHGPWAVIAGGSEGVGREFAVQLAEAGLDLVLIARKQAQLDEAAELCRAHGVEVRTLAADLARPGAAAEVAAATDGLEVGLLIYNAGANTHSAPFLDGDLDAFSAVIDLNVTTMMGLVQHFGRPMRDRGRGGILLVGSMAGYLGSTHHTTYGGVKAFGRIFAESLWLELRDHGVQVLELVLGLTRTPAMERVGLNFDVPGLKASEPADVAREGLANLANGPVHVVSGNEETAIRQSHPDRARAVLASHRMIAKLMGLEPA